MRRYYLLFILQNVPELWFHHFTVFICPIGSATEGVQVHSDLLPSAHHANRRVEASKGQGHFSPAHHLSISGEEHLFKHKMTAKKSCKCLQPSFKSLHIQRLRQELTVTFLPSKSSPSSSSSTSSSSSLFAYKSFCTSQGLGTTSKSQSSASSDRTQTHRQTARRLEAAAHDSGHRALKHVETTWRCSPPKPGLKSRGNMIPQPIISPSKQRCPNASPTPLPWNNFPSSVKNKGGGGDKTEDDCQCLHKSFSPGPFLLINKLKYNLLNI